MTEPELRAAISLIRTLRRISWQWRRMDCPMEARQARDKAWWWVNRAHMWRDRIKEKQHKAKEVA